MSTTQPPLNIEIGQQVRDSGKKVFKLVGSVFAVIGVGFILGAGGSGNRQYSILKKWPAADAQVASSRVTRGRDSQGTTMYGAEIEFRYSVSGKEYTTPASPGYTTSSYLEMKRNVETYAPGTRHSIRYNPADPNVIRYAVGYTFGFFFLPVLLGGMGLVFGGVGSGLLFAARSTRGKSCPTCGQSVERGQDFCPHCAAPLSRD